MIFPEAEVREWVAGCLAGIFKPEPNEEIYEWAERTLRIPPTENEEMAGMLWSSSYSPYLRELMRWVKRPGKGEFWIKKSSQTGFTMGILIIICWMIVHRPGNIAYAVDSIDEARKISRSRLQRWIELNRLLEEIGEPEESVSNLVYSFKGSTVYMLGAYSPGGWANKSIALFILDELDKHPYIEGEGTTVTLARERCKRPKNAKIIGFSTPGETDEITTQWRLGTQEEVRFAFPCCGHVQALKKENLVYSSKEFKDLAGGYLLDKVASHAYFKCELCGGRLLDEQKRTAMQSCELVPTNEKGQPGVRSLHIWDAYSAFVTFGQIAVEWIAAEGNPLLLERLYRGKFGEQYERTGRSLKHEDILACRGKKEDGTYYEKGTIPFEPVWLAQFTDVQGDVQKSAKIAIDSKFNFWFSDWKITMDLSTAFEWYAEPVIGPDGKCYYCTDGFCDEGYNTQKVRELCMEYENQIWPIKGVDVNRVAELVSSKFFWVNLYQEEILVYHISDYEFKWQLINMLNHRKKRLKKGEPVLYLPSDTDPDDDFIVDELCNEFPVKKTNKISGKEKWEFKKIGPNDGLDLLKYAMAMFTVKRPFLVRDGITR